MSAVPAGGQITVALSSDFLSAMARIPRNQQKKVIEFIEKFRGDPTRSGINYEKIKQAKDIVEGPARHRHALSVRSVDAGPDPCG